MLFYRLDLLFIWRCVFLRRDEFDQLPALVIDFLRHLEIIKNKSELTVLEYASDLRMFFRFILKIRCLTKCENFEDIDISEIDLAFIKTITLNDAYEFIVFCKTKRHNNERTRSRKISSLKAFFKYLTIQMKLLDENPFRELERPNIKKSLPKYLTLEQSLNLLGCVDGANKERDYCILTLFLNCGLRLSELVSLNCTDIREDNTMRVTGKGNKERTIYLNDACVSAIKSYLKVRPKVTSYADKNALFISRHKRRISPKTVQHIVKTFLEKSGLANQGLSTHKLRHTAATLMYQHGKVDVLLIKEILGHENLSTTEIYTHIASDQLKNAVDANPLSKVERLDTSSDEDSSDDEDV